MKQIFSPFEKITVPTSDGFVLVPMNEIVYCVSDGNYTDFVLNDDRVLNSSYTLKEYVNILHPGNFVRVHKSYLINLDHIARYIRKGKGGVIVMTNDQSIKVSRRSKDFVMKILQECLLAGDLAAKFELSGRRKNKTRTVKMQIESQEADEKRDLTDVNPENVLNRLTLIMTVMELGFKLSEIGTFLELDGEESNAVKRLVHNLEDEIKQVDNHFEKLSLLKRNLTDSLQKCLNKEPESVTIVPSAPARNSGA